jgi:NADH-quinone oxidoreductase subunit N
MAILYYLTGYLFTLGAVFVVLCLVSRQSDDISTLAGLNQRSPFLATVMAMAMVSLAGVPPLAGFAGKLLLLKAVVERASENHAYYWLALLAVVGVILSMYYYFGVIRTIYWSKDPPDVSPIAVSTPMKISLAVCAAGMLCLGLFPFSVLEAAAQAVTALKF